MSFLNDLSVAVAQVLGRRAAPKRKPEDIPVYNQRDWQNAHYPLFYWYIVLAVIGLLALSYVFDKGMTMWRKYRILNRRLTEKQLPYAEQQRPRNGTAGFQVGRIPIALVNVTRILSFRWTFPFTEATLTDAFVTLAYVGLMFLWSFVSTRNNNMKIWGSRTGAIASCQVPLLPVLAAKNNIITLVTGISHERLLPLHRAAGRAMLILLWVHAGAKYVGGVKQFVDLPTQMAVVSLICFTLTFFLSLPWVRKYCYEFFIVTHCILICGYMVGGWIHAHHYEKGYWFWSGLALWALDRVVRLIRVIWIARPGNKEIAREARIELISEDTVRLSMLRPITWQPGQHAFITVPGISAYPLEAHPFTIATIPDPPTRESTDSGSQREVSFIIRGRKGFTGKLRNQAAMSRQTGRNIVNVYFDGPYGVPPDLSSFSTAVLIAGGSGVSYTISMLENLVQEARKGTSACQRVVFIWSIRDEAHIAWIYSQLLAVLACIPPELSVSVRIFVTRAPGFLGRLPFENGVQRAPTFESEKFAGKEKLSLTSYPEVRIEYGRPDVAQLLLEEASVAQGAMSVDVSGPAALIKTVRSACRASHIAGPGAIARGMPSLTLHVEMFSM
ncbi:ferric reductase NAD binding domain-containing protein [Auriculariales sp. MPI-PUGE-AT-0066]|nr:ferric reductase NAD binding domain-containing protein [Auriculariales sp. MPI-PUGE-AT-0066]